MMNKPGRELVRVVLISPEVVVGLLVYLFLFFLAAERSRHFGSMLYSRQLEGWSLTWLGLPLPVLLAGYALALAILNPEKRKELADWPDYWRLKLRVYTSLGWMVAAALGWFVGWDLIQQALPTEGFVCGAVSLAISTTSLASLALARQGVRDALDLTS